MVFIDVSCFVKSYSRKGYSIVAYMQTVYLTAKIPFSTHTAMEEKTGAFLLNPGDVGRGLKRPVFYTQYDRYTLS